MTCNEIFKKRLVSKKWKDLIDINIADIFQMVIRESIDHKDSWGDDINKHNIKHLQKMGKLNHDGFIEWCKNNMKYRETAARELEEQNSKYSCHECGRILGKVEYEQKEYENPVVLCNNCYRGLSPAQRRNWGFN